MEGELSPAELGKERARPLSLGLAPLAIGISADFYVAVGKILVYGTGEAAGAVVIFLVLVSAWFFIPRGLSLRSSARGECDSPNATII